MITCAEKLLYVFQQSYFTYAFTVFPQNIPVERNFRSSFLKSKTQILDLRC